MKTLAKAAFSLLLTTLLFPAQMFACACCAERGDYFKHESNLEDFILQEIEKIGLGSANLHTDAGYPENIKGIDPLGESFSINGLLKGNVWKLEVSDDKSRTSILNLWRPSKVEQYGVDQNPLGKGNTVVLYKELRFKYRVQSATGFLENGIDPETEFHLILQGKGNGCTNASDYSTYILQVKGNKADYSFFGKLNIEEDKVLQTRGDTTGNKASGLPKPKNLL